MGGWVGGSGPRELPRFGPRFVLRFSAPCISAVWAAVCAAVLSRRYCRGLGRGLCRGFGTRVLPWFGSRFVLRFWAACTSAVSAAVSAAVLGRGYCRGFCRFFGPRVLPRLRNPLRGHSRASPCNTTHPCTAPFYAFFRKKSIFFRAKKSMNRFFWKACALLAHGVTLQRLLERRYDRSFSARCSGMPRFQSHSFGPTHRCSSAGRVAGYTQPCARAPCPLLEPRKPPLFGTAPAGLQHRPQPPPLREQTRPLRHAQRSESGVSIRRF
jgi:hypothetical protein